MASSSTQRPSSSSSSTFVSKWRYDVFLNFRGEDTRTNITDHLYSALIRNNINTFRDDEKLPKGGEIAPELLQAIEESRIAVIVFSKTYAHSKWCLEELVNIMSCKMEREQKVIPIFYHVDPSQVRNQEEGIYEKAFTHHEENADEEKREKIRRWKNAMREASNLTGYHVKVDSYESKIIDDIIEKIHAIIPKVLYVNENIVGMNSRLEKLVSRLEIQSNGVRMVGVCGLGGIGKTTIITALYNKISNQFRSISFLTNVREESTKDSGLLKLQQQLLDDTLGVKGQLTLKNIHEGVKVIKDKLSSKKVLVFVDDIDDSKQLEHLVGKHSWFGHGSRIIITTRKKDLLKAHEVDYMYEVDKLNNEEAHQLFCSYAFENHLPGMDYRDLTHQVVRYADGLPLALKVLGSLLSRKEPKDWTSELNKLAEVPNMDITKVLKISYDGLDDTEKRIFLDIACFFRGTRAEVVTTILDGFGFYAESGINALVDRCFITISNKVIEMHDLLTQMGKDIVYKECPNEPGERSRLWRYTDVCRVLKKKMGTEKIEGIFLDDGSTPKQMKFTSQTFKRMTRLRVLGVNYKRVQLSEDFAFPSSDLTFLHWDGYPLPSLPSNFHAASLVYLCLRNSNIEQLWKRNLSLKKLRHMILHGLKQLIEIPKFSTMPNLEYLTLSGCVSLESLPGDIHELKHLSHLHCKGCSKLTSFPKFERNIGKLADLRLNGTAIKELPSSIEFLKDLRDLHLRNCKNLESLPDNICNLSSLRTLTLDGCSKLRKLPKDLGRMPCLETLSLRLVSCRLPSLSVLSLSRILYLDACNITPTVIKRKNSLNALEELSLRNCNLNGGVLNTIFHLCSLKVLDLSLCNLKEGGILTDMLVGISQLSNLIALGLSHCKKLSQIPELPSSLRLLDACSSIGTSLPPMHSLVNCLKSANQDLEDKRSSNEVFLTNSRYHGQGTCIVVQGSSGIPEWIRNQKEGSCINIKLPRVWYENNEFLGVALCCVYVPLDGCEDIPESNYAHESKIEFGEESLNADVDFLGIGYPFTIELACILVFGDEYGSPSMFRQDLHFGTICESYHNEGASLEQQMWVTLYPKVAITEIFCSNQFTSILAEFSTPNLKNWKVLKCGFQPIYAYDPNIQTRDMDVGCFDCQRNVENWKLCLKGQPINQLCIPTTATNAVDTLCLRDCKNLESLSKSIWDQLKSLKSLFLSNCSHLCIPTAVANAVDTLCLRDCKNLESLPTSISWELKSLKSLFCSHCSQLSRFPQVLTNMEYLRELHLDGTAIEQLPSSIEHLNRLEILNLRGCQELVTLPESICNLCFLKHLDVSYCSKLHKLPQNLGRLKSLKVLYAFGLNSMCCQLLSLSSLCSLKSLYLSESTLMPRGVIMSDICCLNSLQVLDLGYCKIDEGGIPSEIWRLSSLVGLYLNANRFRSMPTWISQLSMLRSLNMSHCLGLVQIAELPSSLRVLDVHGCRLLETSSPLLSSSLFKCFRSAIQDLECRIDVRPTGVHVFISGSGGIPKRVKSQKNGSEVVAKLPKKWYKDSDLLGFVLYSIYDHPVLTDNESEARQEMDGTYFNCGLSLLGHECQLVNDVPIEFRCNCIEVMWMFYYPKVAIENKYRSNKWKQLKASFSGCSYGKAMKVKKCGIHLIYASDADESMITTIEWECQQDELKSLTPLICLGCPGFINSIPETLEDVENLKVLHLDGTTIKELPASIQHLKGLQFLNLEYCNNLVSLPKTICDLKSLTILSCFGCSNLRGFPEIWKCMENLVKLNMGGSAIEALPSSIENLRGLQILNLRCCNNLRSLPSTICELKSLTTLFCSGCSRLKSFPEILGDMGNLKRLHLDGTAMEELPESIQHLPGLQSLDLTHCKNLVRLPESICYLKSLITLSCSSCSNLRVFPEISENMENLTDLDLRGTSIKELSSSIQHLGGLQHLYLQNCRNLVNIPESICKLSSLKELYVHFCTDLEKFPVNLGSFQCLEVLGVSGLNLSKDCFSSIAADIIQLSKLRVLSLSHCPKLLQVPDLPPTLRALDVHNCTCLETLSSLSRLLDFSLLKCFKSTIEELECGTYWSKAIRVVTPGNNGIPEWIRHREKGSQIIVELPPDWHNNNDFLGFAIYSIFIPSDPGWLNCKLNFCGDGGSGSWDVDNVQVTCCHICAGLNQMCVAYYPKLAIENHYWSNKWRSLKASFHGDDGLPVEVKECGTHLIYTQDILKDTGTDTDDSHRRRWDNTQGTEHNDDQLMI